MLDKNIFQILLHNAQRELLEPSAPDTKEKLQIQFAIDRMHYEYLENSHAEKLNFLKEVNQVSEDFASHIEELRKNIDTELKRLAEQEKHD